LPKIKLYAPKKERNKKTKVTGIITTDKIPKTKFPHKKKIDTDPKWNKARGSNKIWQDRQTEIVVHKNRIMGLVIDTLNKGIKRRIDNTPTKVS
jgi:hypothetical protein